MKHVGSVFPKAQDNIKCLWKKTMHILKEIFFFFFIIYKYLR